jgi:hypothetical protein
MTKENSILRFLIGKLAIPDHPATCLNPNGRNGFLISEAKLHEARILLRGADTMWFGQSMILEIRDPWFSDESGA